MNIFSFKKNDYKEEVEEKHLREKTINDSDKLKEVLGFSKNKFKNSLDSLKNVHNYMYDIIFSCILLFLSTTLFYIFSKSVNGDFESHWTWTLPVFVFSLFIIFFVIFLVTVHLKQVLWAVVFLTFSTSLFFAFYFYHFLVIILMFFYTIFYARQMRKALVDSVTIHFGNLVSLGFGSIIFSLAVILSSQYYWLVYKQSLTDILFHLDNVKISEKVLDKYLASKSKDIGEDDQQLKSSQVSVNEFLLMLTKNDDVVTENEENIKTSNETSSENPGTVKSFLSNVGFNDINVEQKFNDLKTNISDKKDEALISLMRNNLSKQLGQELNGDENIAEVFDKAMYEKIASYFSQDKDIKDESKLSYLALILAFLLFFSLLTIRTFLTPVWTYLTIGLFYLLKNLNIIRVVKVERETEMIILPSAV